MFSSLEFRVLVFKSLGLPINIQVLGSRIVVLWRKKLGEKLITRYVTDYNARISPFGFIYHGLPHHSKSNLFDPALL